MCDLVGQHARIGQILQALELIVVQPQVLVLALVFLKGGLDLRHQHLHLAAFEFGGRRCGRLRLGSHAQVGTGHLVQHPCALLCLDQHLIGVVGHADNLFDHRQDAQVVQFGQGGVIGAWVTLRQQQHAAVRSLRLIHSPLALGAPHVDIHGDAGQNHEISKGDNGKFPNHACSLKPKPERFREEVRLMRGACRRACLWRTTP